MILIIGGAYQGKQAFLMRRWNITDKQITDAAALDGNDCGGDVSAIINCRSEVRAVVNYQEMVRRQLEEGLDPAEELQKLIGHRPDLIIAANEVGMGIVPMDRRDRDFREAAGRTLCLAAGLADEVWRVICGIEERIR